MEINMTWSVAWVVDREIQLYACLGFHQEKMISWREFKANTYHKSSAESQSQMSGIT